MPQWKHTRFPWRNPCGYNVTWNYKIYKTNVFTARKLNNNTLLSLYLWRTKHPSKRESGEKKSGNPAVYHFRCKLRTSIASIHTSLATAIRFNARGRWGFYYSFAPQALSDIASLHLVHMTQLSRDRVNNSLLANNLHTFWYCRFLKLMSRCGRNVSLCNFCC